MIVRCEVVPPSHLDPDRLKHLGAALRALFARAVGEVAALRGSRASGVEAVLIVGAGEGIRSRLADDTRA